MDSGTTTPGSRCLTPAKSAAEIRNSPRSDAGISPRVSDELDQRTSGESLRQRSPSGDISNQKQSQRVISGPGNTEYVMDVIRHTDGESGTSKARHPEEARNFIEENWTDNAVYERGKPRTMKLAGGKHSYRIDYTGAYKSQESDQRTYATLCVEVGKTKHACAHIEVDVNFGKDLIQQALCLSLDEGYQVTLMSRQRESASEPGRKIPKTKSKEKQQSSGSKTT